MRLTFFLPVALFPLTAFANTQETLIGIAGKDFVVIGADSSLATPGGISWTVPAGVDKISELKNNLLVAAVGDPAESERLISLLQAHCTIREYEAGMGLDVDYSSSERTAVSPAGLSVDAVAHLARNQIWQSLRSRNRMNVCMLVAGMVPPASSSGSSAFSTRIQSQVQLAVSGTVVAAETSTTPTTACLYWIDQYGSQQRLKYGAHGYASNFCLSLLDQHYFSDISRKEAVLLLRKCFEQLKERYIIHSPQPPCIKLLDASGSQLIEY